MFDTIPSRESIDFKDEAELKKWKEQLIKVNYNAHRMLDEHIMLNLLHEDEKDEMKEVIKNIYSEF